MSSKRAFITTHADAGDSMVHIAFPVAIKQKLRSASNNGILFPKLVLHSTETEPFKNDILNLKCEKGEIAFLRTINIINKYEIV